MSDRTTETSVTFRNAFKLTSFDTEQPAGTYRLVMDEEEVLGLSFLAYRRVATMLHTPSIVAAGSDAGSSSGPHRVFPVDPAELASALEADARV
jgi:hypothetical protein